MLKSIIDSEPMSDLRNLQDLKRRSLREMMRRPDDQISLAEAALLIAESEYPGLDTRKYIQRLDTMAANIGVRIGGETNSLNIIGRINDYLYEEEGFSGNSEDYYDPRNSFLNEVLDRKTGIPITLSTIYLEIAERLKIPLVGVGLPGHFLVKHPYFDILIDPFSRGRILTEEDCRAQMKQLLGESVPFHRSFLAGVSKRHIVSRLLNNLRAIYVNARQFQKALHITDMSLDVNPSSPSELKQRAAVLIHLRRHADAIRDLDLYLEEEPDAEDAKEIRQVIIDLRKGLAQLN